jgi:hypothetical protein
LRNSGHYYISFAFSRLEHFVVGTCDWNRNYTALLVLFYCTELSCHIIEYKISLFAIPCYRNATWRYMWKYDFQHHSIIPCLLFFCEIHRIISFQCGKSHQKARVQFLADLYVICCEQSVSRIGSSPSTSVSPVSIIPPMLHTHSFIYHHVLCIALVTPRVMQCAW